MKNDEENNCYKNKHINEAWEFIKRTALVPGKDNDGDMFHPQQVIRALNKIDEPLQLEIENLSGKLLTAERELHLLEKYMELTNLETDPPEENENVLFWIVPIMEPPYCGSMLDTDFEHDYYTHWSPLPKVKEPILEK